jgi:cold shock CspA family protein
MQQHGNVGRLIKSFGSYGFILFEDQEVFVHFKNYLGGFHPEINQIVMFDFGPPIRPGSRQRPQALRVRVVRSAADFERDSFTILQANARRALSGDGGAA